MILDGRAERPIMGLGGACSTRSAPPLDFRAPERAQPPEGARRRARGRATQHRASGGGGGPARATTSAQARRGRRRARQRAAQAERAGRDEGAADHGADAARRGRSRTSSGAGDAAAEAGPQAAGGPPERGGGRRKEGRPCPRRPSLSTSPQGGQISPRTGTFQQVAHNSRAGRNI